MYSKEQLTKFWDKVIIGKKNECWLWTGAKINGYGRMKINGMGTQAHRISWVIYNENIPNGMFICHKCDNPPCVNPLHLFCGTHQDNMQDAIAKGRFKFCLGRRFKKFNVPANRILTTKQARIIQRKMLNRGKQTLKQLADELELKVSLLKDISVGRSYINI